MKSIIFLTHKFKYSKKYSQQKYIFHNDRVLEIFFEQVYSKSKLVTVEDVNKAILKAKDFQFNRLSPNVECNYKKFKNILSCIRNENSNN